MNSSPDALKNLMSQLQGNVECPLCFKFFPQSLIDQHASSCEAYVFSSPAATARPSQVHEIIIESSPECQIIMDDEDEQMEELELPPSTLFANSFNVESNYDAHDFSEIEDYVPLDPMVDEAYFNQLEASSKRSKRTSDAFEEFDEERPKENKKNGKKWNNSKSYKGKANYSGGKRTSGIKPVGLERKGKGAAAMFETAKSYGETIKKGGGYNYYQDEFDGDGTSGMGWEGLGTSTFF